MKFQKIAFLCLASCALAQTEGPEGLKGIWLTDGHGLIAEIQGGRARAYQVAGNVCVPQSRRWERLSSFLDGIDVDIQPDGQADRVAPSRVPQPASGHTDGQFNAFAAFFSHNYVFFDLYGVDWQARVSKARPQIRPDMTDSD